MTIKELASEIAKREAKKSQVSIGDVREILGHLSDMVFKDEQNAKEASILLALYQNGLRRSKRKKK